MVSYKLIYFNIMGRAELTRVMFAQAGVKYEDVRLTREEWAKLKPTTVFGQLPLLEIDGVQYSQSAAINGYLSNEFGFSGKDNKERLQVEMIGFCLHDMAMKLPFMMEEGKKKDDEYKRIFEEEITPLLKKLEDLLSKSKSGYFVSKLSSADMGWMLTSHFFELKSPGILKDFPKLEALGKKVAGEERIAAWIKKRPQTSM